MEITLWYLGWWVTPSSTSFSGMMRDCDAYGGFARSVLEQTWEHVPQSVSMLTARQVHESLQSGVSKKQHRLFHPCKSSWNFFYAGGSEPSQVWLVSLDGAVDLRPFVPFTSHVSDSVP